MEQLKRIKKISLLTLPISILMAITSLYGIFSDSIYLHETKNYAAQAIGQDFVNLFFVLPVFIISFILLQRSVFVSLFIWCGTLMYIIYTFVIFCFGVHFNILFLIYCLTLGFSIYLLIGTISSLDYSKIREQFNTEHSTKITSLYLFIIAGMFYLIWLKEIIPAIIKNKIPQSILDSGLPTSPVFVLDISIVLPALIIAGILLLKKKSFGYFIAPCLLTFLIVMTMAVGGMFISLNAKGFQNDLSLISVFTLLSVTGIVVFTLLFKKCLNN